MSRRKTSRAIVVAAIAVAAIGLVPIVYLALRASEDRAGFGAIFDASFAALVGKSVALALTTGVIATALALIFAVMLEAIDVPLRRVATVLVVLPLAIPSYVAATAYVAGISPLGPLGKALKAIGIGPLFPEGFVWSVFVLVTSTVPLAVLPLRAALARADGDLYAAARTLGRSGTQALITALRPVLGRALRGAFVVVVLYTLAELGTVALLRFDALPRVIYHQFLSAFDRAAAARTALVLVALVGIVVVLAGGSASTRVGERGRPLAFRLGRARPFAFALLALYVLLATVVPLISLGAWLAKKPATLMQLWPALAGSMKSAAIVVGPAVIAAVIVAIVAERARGGRTIARVVESGFAIPGLVVALGLSVATLRLAPSLYQGWVPYTLAMMVLFVPLGVTAVRGSLATIPPSFEDAARTLGATRRQAFWRVTLPLVAPSVLAAAALIAISTMKELGGSLLLLPTGQTTLAVKLWDSTEEARYVLAAAPALVLIVLAGITTFAIQRRGIRSV